MKLTRWTPLVVALVAAVWYVPVRLYTVAAEPAPPPTFAVEGVAFLNAHCNKCHGQERPKADLTLTGIKTDADVLKNRKTWQRVIDVIQAGEMPPPSRKQPALADKEKFISILTSIFDKVDRSSAVDPGRVTMRRLNRVEYRNTVRDLCFVDFNAAEDFPSDDIGHGFDNIGDVLTLPPVLMERYLAAADAVMARAIVPNPPPPTNRYLSGQYLEPSSPNPPLKNNARIVTVDPNGDAVKTGPVHTAYKVPSDDEYNLSVQVYAETLGKKPVQIALLAKGSSTAPGIATDQEVEKLTGAALKSLRPFVILKIAAVKSRDPKKPDTIQAKVPAGMDFTRAAVAIVQPPAGEPAPSVHVKLLKLEGPLDPRPHSQRKLLACDPKKPQAEQTREILTRFVSRAYRRPATAEEVQRLIRLVQSAQSSGKSWEAGLQLAMTGVLCSPKFLFRVEVDPSPIPAGPHPISEYQLASRLSYFLWSTMPDEELFRLAADGKLTANLEAQVRRMLADPRSQSLVDRFVFQWLQLERLHTIQADPKLFPKYNDRLRQAMLEETRLFFQEIVREDRSILEILGGNYSYINAQLATLYGIKDTAGNPVGSDPKKAKPGGKRFEPRMGFVRVDLSAVGRGGVLTQASVLTVTSNPTRTSPVKRGKWVLEQLLGTPPPPPPPDVPELEEDGKAIASGSVRQRLEEHRKNPACANCHAKMDALGFGLENFDAIGAFREKDGAFPVDSSGVLPDGGAFSGPAELKQILLEKKDLFTRCLAEKLLTYALGRGLEYYDKRAIDSIVAHTTAHNFQFSSLVIGVVTSDPFRLRRGKDQQ
ncbi:MAG: DUF1592 domain-containing protein [Bacteroidales bacterium]|nr:DUF1592 domain-containing protein [Bacteroidales bacterium]